VIGALERLASANGIELRAMEGRTPLGRGSPAAKLSPGAAFKDPPAKVALIVWDADIPGGLVE
jgi:hypothetical protein